MQMTGMRWPLVAAAVLVGLGAAAGLSRAQTAYKIEPDDEIKIEVWEKPELTRASTVLSDGTVTLPLIGEVRVAGSTPSELEEELARKFSLYDRQITAVSVAVTAYNSKSIFVLGEVARKGATGERNITTVDLNQIWGRGVPTNLPELEPDDTVIVPKKVVEQTWPNVIYVLGAVKTPGVYQKEAAIDLVGELGDAGVDEIAVELIVAVHGRLPRRDRR